MTLVDTSVWADHFGKGVSALAALLEAEQVLVHPFVIGEIALGSLPRMGAVLRDMATLPSAEVASTYEVLTFIDRRELAGSGVGYVDAHLLASAMMTPHAALWTRDKRLLRVAERLGVATS